ncbi:MAG: dephospho-CoA kinase [Lachnospiraceae bacterium]|nr:dephospho-CoA kinase [Lachnospiraceae bacterium]
MMTIGITGGVGAGKSQILSYIEERYNSKVIRADEVAHLLEEPGHECYDRIVALLGSDVLQEDGAIDKKKMAAVIFNDKEKLSGINAIIHPEVKKYIIEQIQTEKKAEVIDFLFIEAALLIEEHYDEIVDEMWYIHTDIEIRSKRLAQSRQYSAERIANIMRGQLSEEEFRKHCSVVIINNGDLEETYKQINYIMGERV